MEFIKKVYQLFDSFDGRLFRYALSFGLLLALAPILIAVILVFKYIIIINEDVYQVFVQVLIQYLPSDIILPFVDWFAKEGEPIGFVATISTLLLSFYLASRSIYSFLLISAQVEHVKASPLYIRFRAIVLTIYFALYIGFAYIVLMYFQHFWLIATTLLAILLFLCMFHALSFYHRPLLYGLAGSLFSVSAFVLLGMLLTKILETFTSYPTVYGPLASFMTLLLSIYIIACIIYLSFCINVVIENTENVQGCLPKYGKIRRWITKLRAGRKRE
ncbi:YhjD/YihY/BrkB family envelope integrity protein [Merdibacter massiliensis]|uniref:YhjD/YihY/BrkB family envelope integrity protein n=1 Tax=Merdibacter massiliensis TaxID=1871030 RepID=UPI00137B59EF|nr:YhjD/YihY/BrkB family envelope integrity protein [Merdibacter massiliensis]